jgi:hypothetical protein
MAHDVSAERESHTIYPGRVPSIVAGGTKSEALDLLSLLE